jgi:hypothetical protein
MPFDGRSTVLTRTIIAAALVAGGIAATPAAAHATAAYTPEQVCGKGFHRVKDGHRAMKTRKGTVYGHVYLMYSKRSGKNCVAAIKTRWAGERTVTGARLVVKGGGRSEDVQRYRYYAETGHVDGSWKCVTYEGWTRDPDNKITAWGGRTSWGNCQG